MFNKKTAKPAKTSKPAVKAAPSVTPNWLYLSDHQVTARDIYEALDPASNQDIQLWAEAGILEIPVAEKASIDMEEMECDLGDEYGNAYLAENHIKTVMMVTIVPAAWDQSKAVMLSITAKCGGFFCGDTEDFLPVVR